MFQERPNPDDLLKAISEKENLQTNKGQLKIFFGYAAGVGKTFAMLEAAHEAKKKGIDVVAGYIEPHTRPETLALLDGLEQLSPQEISYKGIVLKEFDLDAALKRKPQLLLLDELAHSNAQACRHKKRYQDVTELLKAGIDVYTTVNVQHIESLNDIVASITSVIVQERIPDSVFDNAEQIELVDIEPDDLIARLNQGKIYKQKQAQKALHHFFIPDNLISLREIALRRAADRVNKRKASTTAKNNYAIEEHILICLSSSPSNTKVIRTAARMAEAFHGAFTALFVETSQLSEMKEKDQRRLNENVKLAEQLGAKIVTMYGYDVSMQISEYAKISSVSKIVIGRSNNKKTIFNRNKSLVDKLAEFAPNIDIYIIPDIAPSSYNTYKYKKNTVSAIPFSWKDIIKTISILCFTSIVGTIFYYAGFNETNIVTIYILSVLLISSVTTGKLYGIVASFINVFVFNFLFTDPRFTFLAYDSSYPVTFFVMFLASFITSSLTMRVKQQVRQAASKAYHTEVLLQTSQKLQTAKSEKEILKETANQLNKLFETFVVCYPVIEEKLDKPFIFPTELIAEEKGLLSADEQAVAQWVFKNNKHAGMTTDTLPSAKCLYMAVRAHDTVLAVIGMALKDQESFSVLDKNMLISLLAECALALEKEKVLSSKRQVELQAQQEQLRANLLRSISHDLRTPLTSISGNAGILMGNSTVLNEEKKQGLYADIYDDSMWLINLVENLLSVTRIENGTMNISMEPELLDEIINEALKHLNRKSIEHEIQIQLEDDLLMAKMDSRLMIQVIINLVDNAIKYTPEGSKITISAFRKGKLIQVQIADNGKGITDEAKKRIFDMFYTADNHYGDGRRSLGLGLSLCKSIVTAHGGIIDLKNNQPNGTIFFFTLQAEEVSYYEQT